MSSDHGTPAAEEKTAAAVVLRADAIEESRRPRIMFDDEFEDRARGHDPDQDHERDPDQRRTRWEQRQAKGRSRSNSISSVRSRVHATSGIPIGFRTLSFQVSHSQEVPHQPMDNGSGHGQNEDLEYFKAIKFHLMPPEKVCQNFNVDPDQGLGHDAAAQRLQRQGKNVLPKPREKYWTKLFFYVFGGFCSILWLGVIIFFICWRPLGNPPQPYNLGLAILVLIVIMLQACFSAFQDWSTKKTLKSILDLLPSDALVLRGGVLTKINTSDIVTGDIVSINIGNKVPADLRLISTSGDLRFDRAVLTGESEEVDGALDATDDNYLETHNIALMGSIVTNGSAQGVVVVTGSKTAMGTVANATANVQDKPTLIQREITRFVKIIVCLTACLATLILLTWAGWLRKDHFAFMNVVAMLNDVMGCVVAFIPEGMPVGVALTLMMVARRMKSAKVLPKGLSTVETLGCVNVICSDKTGTLTENRMSVTSIGFVDKLLTTKEVFQTGNTESEMPLALSTMIRASHLCNDSSFDPLSLHLPVMERQVQGNATDGAVLRFAEAAKPGKEVHGSYRKIFQTSFNSTTKWMLTMHESIESGTAPDRKDNSQYLVTVKGAPDVLLPKCTNYLSLEDGEEKPMDENTRERCRQLQEQLSGKAERVILFCQRRYTPAAALGSNEFSDEINTKCLEDLTVVGILGIIDPPRPEAGITVASCRRAGIRFFMVTGDYGLTGAAIARQVGIFTGSGPPDTFTDIVEMAKANDSDEKQARSFQSLLLEGSHITQLEDAHWDIVCQYQEIVFGRTTPNQKLLIVTALQKRGNAVAVTGDGVNDAPALRAADVGVAIVTGSDVALDAADLILLDNFDAIIDAIRLGRLVFQNLQKVISYLLPAGSWSEIWPVLLNVFLGVPLPLSSFLMIIICVFTDLFLSLSLIMEKEEFDLLELPPRNHKRDHLINLKIYVQSYLFIGIMETVCAHAMFFLYMYRHAGIPAHALFLAFEKYSDGFYGYSQAELTYFNTVGQGVYFVTLVILQWGNILSIRNKRMSILQADPFRRQRRNPWLLLSMAVSLAIAVFVTQEPGIQRIFGTAAVPLEFWFLPLPLALGILVMDETRKLLVRTWPRGPLARIAW